MTSRKGFTLVELMVVILIVGILAAVAIPLMQGRIDKAKWSEANATAGTIRTAVRAYAAETSISSAEALKDQTLSSADTLAKLGFVEADLTGTYFKAACYKITDVDSTGVAEITVDGSQGNTEAPTGSYKLTLAGKWEKQAAAASGS